MNFLNNFFILNLINFDIIDLISLYLKLVFLWWSILFIYLGVACIGSVRSMYERVLIKTKKYEN